MLSLHHRILKMEMNLVSVVVALQMIPKSFGVDWDKKCSVKSCIVSFDYCWTDLGIVDSSFTQFAFRGTGT